MDILDLQPKHVRQCFYSPPEGGAGAGAGADAGAGAGAGASFSRNEKSNRSVRLTYDYYFPQHQAALKSMSHLAYTHKRDGALKASTCGIKKPKTCCLLMYGVR